MERYLAGDWNEIWEKSGVVTFTFPFVIAKEARPTSGYRAQRHLPLQGAAGHVLIFPWITTADKQPRDDKRIQSSIVDRQSFSIEYRTESEA